MVAENIFVQLSGTAFDSAVLAGSNTIGLTILCGMSGTACIPVMVNSSGAIQTEVM